MPGDFSRFSFDEKKRYSGVRLQQGRVQLDADLNELSEILEHRVGAGLADLVGRDGAPKDQAGFEIQIRDDRQSLQIGSPERRGRFYVDGTLCQCEPQHDLLEQADLPWPDEKPVDHNGQRLNPGYYLVYLDVWQRELTAMDDPSLLDPALGGADTATRTKNICQVKLLPVPVDANPASNREDDERTAIHTATEMMAAMNRREENGSPTLAPSTLETALPLENQLYRIEIHDEGPPGKATFKWALDNASVGCRGVLSGNSLRVTRWGAGAGARLQRGDWVELCDQQRILQGRPGVLARIEDFDPSRLEFAAESKDDLLELEGSLVVTRWDCFNIAPSSEPQLLQTASQPQPIDDRFQIAFPTDETAVLRTGDFWMIPTRHVDNQLLWPRTGDEGPYEPAARHGVRHRFAALALVRWTGSAFSQLIDQRRMFPGLTEFQRQSVFDHLDDGRLSLRVRDHEEMRFGDRVDDWSKATMKPIGKPFSVHRSRFLQRVEFRDDGQRALFNCVDDDDREYLGLFDTTTGEVVAKSAPTISSVFMGSGESRSLQKGETDEIVRLRYEDGSQGSSWKSQTDEPVLRGFLSPDGQTALILTHRYARLIDVTSGQLLSQPYRHHMSGDLENVPAAFQPDGSRVVLACNTPDVLLDWTIGSGNPPRVWRLDASALSLSIGVHGQIAMMRNEGFTGRVCLLDPIQGTGSFVPLALGANSFAEQERLLIGGTDHLQVFNTATREQLAELPFGVVLQPDEMFRVCYVAGCSLDGRRIVHIQFDLETEILHGQFWELHVPRRSQSHIFSPLRMEGPLSVQGATHLAGGLTLPPGKPVHGVPVVDFRRVEVSLEQGAAFRIGDSPAKSASVRFPTPVLHAQAMLAGWTLEGNNNRRTKIGIVCETCDVDMLDRRKVNFRVRFHSEGNDSEGKDDAFSGTATVLVIAHLAQSLPAVSVSAVAKPRLMLMLDTQARRGGDPRGDHARRHQWLNPDRYELEVFEESDYVDQVNPKWAKMMDRGEADAIILNIHSGHSIPWDMRGAQERGVPIVNLEYWPEFPASFDYENFYSRAANPKDAAHDVAMQLNSLLGSSSPHKVVLLTDQSGGTIFDHLTATLGRTLLDLWSFGSVDAGNTRTESVQAVSDLLKMHADLSAIFCINRHQMLAARQALEDDGIHPGKILVVGLGFNYEIAELIRDDWVAAVADLRIEETVTAAFDTVLAVFAGEKVQRFVTIPHKLVTKESLESEDRQQ